MNTIKISKGQHLTDVLDTIPSNTILHKTITGCGATFCEIKSPRNSIIIEPNKPVIIGKCSSRVHENDNLFGVYEGVYTDTIEDYIKETTTSGKFIKIMTTPESFRKVKDAFANTDIDIRFECFVLFDECHKLIKDVDFREDIALPMDFFFECAFKALVSATVPSKYYDNRFDEFDVLHIEPDYDYTQKIWIEATNNVLERVKRFITKKADDNTPIFFFLNSTDSIYSLMKQCNIMEDSMVFCADKSVKKLKDLGFKSVSDTWNINSMKKYNWMTSRFYNALDIELDVQPYVVMITECFVAPYSMMDPFTDSIQVVGRFRNGVKKFIHISNTDKKIAIKDMKKIEIEYECMKEVYKVMNTLKDSASSVDLKNAYYSAIQTLPYNRFLDSFGKENSFMVDNYLDDELVCTYYNNPERLCATYNQSPHFKACFEYSDYPFGEFEKLTIMDKSVSLKQKRIQLVEMLDSLGECNTEMQCEMKRELAYADSFIVKAYDILGKDEIIRLDYSLRKIREAIILKQHNEHASGTEAIELINNKFYPHTWYSIDYIRTELKKIFDRLSIPHLKAITGATIQEYFDAIPQRTKNARGYFLIKPKFVVG